MNIIEVGKLLAVAAGFDNRHADDLQTAAWHELLGGYTYTQCHAALIGHYRDPDTRHKYLTAAHILDRLEIAERGKTYDIEADVRSAKARGLIDDSWPRREPLPPDVAALLKIARQNDTKAALEAVAAETP